MNGAAIILVLLSTGFHAGWNLLGKSRRRKVLFFDRMLAVVAAVGFFPALVLQLTAAPLTPVAGVCAVVSGVFCGLYYYFLMRGYAEADFSMVYPVARALPVLVLGVLDAVRGHPPTAGGWLGMLLVTCGCILAPQTSVRGFDLRVYRSRAIRFIAATAGGTVGYTFVDKIASERVPPGGMSAAVYGYAFFLVSWLVFRTIARRLLEEESAASPRGRPGVVGRDAVIGALMNFGSYWLVLWAYQIASRAAYVVAFRQFSIVIGVAAALVLYKEAGARVRLIAALCITAGLILIAVV